MLIFLYINIFGGKAMKRLLKTKDLQTVLYGIVRILKKNDEFSYKSYNKERKSILLLRSSALKNEMEVLRFIGKIKKELRETGEIYISPKEVNIFDDNIVSTQAFRGNYSYNTTYTGYIPGTITVYMTQGVNYQHYTSYNNFPKIKIDFKQYLKCVVTGEYGPARVAEMNVQILVCKQYALWYMVYQLEYNDASFDVYDSSSYDQNYVYNAYDNLLPRYKAVIDKDFSNYYYYHYIVGSKYGNFFARGIKVRIIR